MRRSVLSVALWCLITACDAPATTAPGTHHADLGITLTSIASDDVTLVSTTDHDVHVLMFWATYCPCFAELGELQQIYNRLEDRGLNVYAISVDGPSSVSRVPGIAAQERWTFPVLYDPDTRLMARYSPKGEVPFYVVLDADGNVLKSHQGYMIGDFIPFEKFLVDHLTTAGDPTARATRPGGRHHERASNDVNTGVTQTRRSGCALRVGC